MDFLMETIPRIPPLVIMRDTQFCVCGSGYDTHLWLAPHIMRCSNAFIIYDPDGSLKKQYGKTFNCNGYNIKVLNTAKVRMSTRYNPFEYIRSDKDIPKLVNALITGTKGNGSPGDINFITAETMLLTALISYINNEAPKIEQNIITLILMLEYMKPDDDYEDDYEYKHAVDYLFEEKETYDPDHLSLRQYKNFKEMTGADTKNIIASCAARLAPFNTEEIKDFMSNDELELDWLHFPNTVLFVIPGNAGSPFNFIVPLMYSQLFDVIGEKSVQ